MMPGEQLEGLQQRFQLLGSRESGSRDGLVYSIWGSIGSV